MAHVSFVAGFDPTTFEADWEDLRFGSLTYVDQSHVRLNYHDSFWALQADFFGAFAQDPIRGTVTDFSYGGISLSNMSISLDRLLGLAETTSVPTFLKGVLAGDDVVQGSSGNDDLSGFYGNDLIYGYEGNDRLDGGPGIDKMFGGAGDDLYIVRDATDYAYENAGEGIDRVISAVSYELRANVENLSLTGTADLNGRGNELDNVIAGNSGTNHLYGFGGDDRISGGAGNDLLDGGAGQDRLAGGTGNDTYVVDSAGDLVIEKAGEGTDTVRTTVDYTLPDNVENGVATGAALNGNSLDNRLYGDSFSSVHGGEGNDHLYGQHAALYGDAGNDVLSGSQSGLDGGSGDDVLISLDGQEDGLAGGDGNDTYFIDGYLMHYYSFPDDWWPDDIVENVGGGIDTVYVVDPHDAYTLPANVENGVLEQPGTLYGNELANRLTGSAGHDYLVGNAGDDTIRGGGDNDLLVGGDGDDDLSGEAGDDGLSGGAGADILRGGGGADIFYLHAVTDSAVGASDIITDFQSGLDTLNLSDIDADASVDGNQAFAFIGAAAFTGVAGQLHYEQISGNTYLSGDTNGDGTADFMIKLDGLHTITAADLAL